MTALLDNSTLIWATLAPKLLSRKASSTIESERNVILVSAASAWEIATKVRLGKLPEAEALEREFVGIMNIACYVLLPIDAHDALRAGRLTSDHKDPFDRMIAAQALAQDIPVISSDSKLELFGVRRIW